MIYGRLQQNNHFFSFDNSPYPQKDGVAMGSPLGQALANTFLCHYTKEWLVSCTIKFKPKLYKRYFDDIFGMFQLRDNVKRFADYTSTKQPNSNIRFIFVIEDQNSFSFLDVKLLKH